MTNPFFTIGHSTRTIDELVVLLRAGDVSRVVDVRTMPRSRTNPQFNEESLADSLGAYDIDYTYISVLGGLRSRSKSVDEDVNGFWNNQSFHNYADYALSEEFENGIEELITLGREQRCAVMCAEAVWWRCHRRIIADHLLHRGYEVFHLMGTDRVDPATLTRGASHDANGELVYPAKPASDD